MFTHLWKNGEYKSIWNIYGKMENIIVYEVFNGKEVVLVIIFSRRNEYLIVSFS